MKICCTCKTLLSLDSFHRSTTRQDGLQPNCIECRKTARSNLPEAVAAREARELVHLERWAARKRKAAQITDKRLKKVEQVFKVDEPADEGMLLAQWVNLPRSNWSRDPVGPEFYDIFQFMTPEDEAKFMKVNGGRYADPEAKTGPYIP